MLNHLKIDDIASLHNLGASMPQKHSRRTKRGHCIWYTERLWDLARDLSIIAIPISSIAEFEQNCWFSDDAPPTCKAVAQHAQRIYQADLSYPIILSATGALMDGGHRLGKAWLLGQTTIQAVQFEIDPEPDVVLPAGMSYAAWKRDQDMTAQ
jgi:hypothetical protein